MIKFNIPGKVKVIGTPAEEGGGGKVMLISRGIFESLDTCSMSHPSGDLAPESQLDGSCTIGGPGSLACSSITAEFFGKGAHAGVRSLCRTSKLSPYRPDDPASCGYKAMPWAGINALDAAVSSCGLPDTLIGALTDPSPSDNSISMLRQQLDPNTRVHGLIFGNEDWNTVSLFVPITGNPHIYTLTSSRM